MPMHSLDGLQIGTLPTSKSIANCDGSMPISSLPSLINFLDFGATVSLKEDNDLLTINSEYTASLVLARCRETRAGSHRWQLRFDESLNPDIVIAARLQPGNEEILDYYLLPRLDVLTERLSLRPENGLILDVYRFNNLNFFMEMAQRARVEGAA